ncbi:MAG: hypothetical protein A2268_14645 [Candidatus Raymondbacteria bacterium RifOxyA12_full_50_37]|uniref:Uncharacterized protein n=1 Tax=Candidatus Raymondbacteria bacterium RIFOXYD12_FULL_49_13 TaxID=1817890 RepID=A0A1F7F2D6_UNCRA|nr:MAG: hypothetical protein A2268_14645 [Candidatus Raymondbacteria bacterium RifOxyA12_full_50_37]OGJ87804.1 MAG: hypothetical protein A2350_12590 [Candidatus Raymondbacteria bacterium RifOxyB12_full_50_8]OGJ88658.1 MAG: hypothetical protein A2248_20580 [Candidatus Raymondbacteria bacterium RIFOXYA2_FULL_49_16]OGK00830.1 MAG: hypothetical protein A2519_07835 [Candidatus Raymondbacteria bacterium RIFOXYD12_FULL_49_13]OGK02866.1 MAG: hypothetical protein A2487_17725 [Candidatus Raymondbacteria 
MKWKDIILGASASLAVTILGGIAIYYLTKEPDQNKTEKVVFLIEQSASFKGGSQEVTFATIKVKNDGGVGAKNILVSVLFSTAEIKDFALDVNAGIRETSREINPKSIKLTFESLLPNEGFTLNLLLTAPDKPKVFVRSEASLGVEEKPKSTVQTPKDKLRDIFTYLVPFSALLLGLMGISFLVFVKKRGLFEVMSPDKNNAGFLLLHHGFVDDAITVLNSALHSGRYDVFTLSNLALCKSLKGEHEQARQLIRAANFREKVGHAKAVILFNEALVNITGGKKEEGTKILMKAIEKSPTEIRRYCQCSSILDPYRSDPAIYNLIKID